MSTILDAQVDALYAVPLGQFVKARTALAKTVGGDEATRIKALAKPTTLPWVVNQLRWHERTLYERLLRTGAALRTAQVAALEGRSAKVREATAAHRTALTDAGRAAGVLASRAGLNVDADALQRMLENVSLAETLKETHGRFTEVVQPAGFEALLGVAVKAMPPATAAASSAPPPRLAPEKRGTPRRVDLAARRRAERLEQERANKAAHHAQALAAAEAALATARQQEAAAREAWHAARDLADHAARALQALRIHRATS